MDGEWVILRRATREQKKPGDGKRGSQNQSVHEEYESAIGLPAKRKFVRNQWSPCAVTPGKNLGRPPEAGYCPVARDGRFVLISTCKVSKPPVMEKNIISKVGPLRRTLSILFLAAAIAATLGTVASSRAVSRPNGPAQSAALRKIAPWVTQHTTNGQQAEFMIILADQADLSGAAALKTKKGKAALCATLCGIRAGRRKVPSLSGSMSIGLSIVPFTSSTRFG